MAALLEVEDLSLAIAGQPLLRGVSLSLQAGEILGLVGESGSGKSLTALSIIGLAPDDAAVAGSIRLNGERLDGLNDQARRAYRGRDIGIVFQEPQTALNPVQTIGAQVAEAIRLHERMPRGRARVRARQVLDRVGLPGPRFGLGLYPHELSGGQRQRVAIAIALAAGPRLLLADEPTTALDVTTQAHILDLLKRLAREDGIGLILVSHDLAVVAQTADRIMVLKDGAVVETLSTDALAPRHPYTQRLAADAAYRRPSHAAPGPDAPPVLEVRGLSHIYGASRRSLFGRTKPLHALTDVSFDVRRGETVALVGESGSGKSTLLRAILALDRLQAGEVRLNGQAFSALGESARRPLRRNLQAVLQDPYSSFDPRWTVERLVAEPLHLLQSPPAAAERRRRVAEALEQVGLAADAGERLPHQFSGGQRQRIAIARALVTEPDLIVLDEAVSALDVTVRAGILDLLADLSAQRGVAYLFITHDIALVQAFTDRVLVLKEGRIVDSGPTARLFESPGHPYTAELIAAAPRLDFAFAEPQP